MLLSLFLSWRSQISSICSLFFIKCNTSLPFSHTLASYHFHGRYLYSNKLTNIPSGAFTGLTALQKLWERGSYTFLWIDCVIYCFGIPSLSERVCFRLVRSRNGILLWLGLNVIVMLFFAYVCFSFVEIANVFHLLSFLQKIWPISPWLSHTGLLSFLWQRYLIQCHYQRPQRRLHRPDCAKHFVRVGICDTFVGIDSVISSVWNPLIV